MKRIGVCLSGCGVYDGSEIQEAVFTLLALDQQGAKAICFAPDISLDEVDHISGEPTGSTRSVLTESARICRGDIRSIKEVKYTELDALIFPGGFGAAKNLSDFASAGAESKLEPSVARLAREMKESGKPMGAMCIAPALLALMYRNQLEVVELTIGDDKETAGQLEKMDATHCKCSVTEICADMENHVVTTPAYMLGQGPAEVNQGIQELVKKVLSMIG